VQICDKKNVATQIQQIAGQVPEQAYVRSIAMRWHGKSWQDG